MNTCGDPEVVLKHRPKRLFIEMVESTSKELPLVHGKRIYTLTVRPKEWSIDGHGNVQVIRYGFPIVPDFGGTPHANCGSILGAEIGDVLG